MKETEGRKLRLKSRLNKKGSIEAGKYPEPNNAFIKGLQYPGIGENTLDKKIVMPLIFPESETYPSRLITYSHQEWRIAVMYGEKRLQLSPNFYLPYNFKDREKYRFQIGQHDFDQDGVPELVFGMNDGIHTKVGIMRYHPPAFSHSALRRQNWEQTFEVEGMWDAYVTDQSLRFNIGGQGLYKEWTWMKGKFVQNEGG